MGSSSRSRSSPSRAAAQSDDRAVPRLGARVASGVIGVGCLLVVTWAVWPLYIFPLELEARESCSWAQALALLDGDRIYDHTDRAFANMNHGPFLHVLLAGLGAALGPFFDGPAQIARLPGLLLPWILFGCTAWILGNAPPARTRWLVPAAAGLIAASVFWALLSTGTYMTIIGRTDAPALAALALLVAWTVRPPTGLRGNRGQLVIDAVTGALVATVFLTNWRQTPAAAVVGAIGLVREEWPRSLLTGVGRRIVMQALGFSVVVLGVLALSGGDGASFYRHTFGFFGQDSGWGVKEAPSLGKYWAVLVEQPLLLLLPTVALGTLAFVVMQPRAQSVRGLLEPTALWSLACLLATGAFAAALWKNLQGGGLWYFAPAWLLLWATLMVFLRERLRSVKGWTGALAGIVGAVILLMRNEPFLQARSMVTANQAQANQFAQAVAAINERFPVHSEDLFYHRTEGSGLVVDMGDVVSRVSKTGYYGTNFGQTFQTYLSGLTTDPPEAIVIGTCASPEFQAFLQKGSYVVLGSSPNRPQISGFNQSHLLALKSKIPEIQEILKPLQGR